MREAKFCPHCNTRYPADKTTCYKDGSALFELAPPDDLVGEVLAEKFKVEKKLGAGGFGAVYLATNLTLGRKDAVKLLKPELASDPTTVQRFLQEARLATRLSHHHTVTTYDLYQDKERGGAFVLAMELLDGEDLRTVLKREKRLDWRRAVSIASQVCESLEEAHAQGVVHRDLKPANIMLCKKFGQDDFVKVLDFGIAKAFEGGDEPSLTATGGFVGTPAFMSPEHIAGKDLDGRSDIYSLGVILYELLSGKLPFKAKDTAMLVQMKVTVRPTPLSESCPDSDVPDELKHLVMSMMGMMPDERPASVAQVRQRLAALLATAPAAPAPDDSFALDETLDSKPESPSPPVPPEGGTMGYEEGAPLRTMPDSSPVRETEIDAPISLPPAEFESAPSMLQRIPKLPAAVGSGVAVLLVALFIWAPWSPPLMGGKAVGVAPEEGKADITAAAAADVSYDAPTLIAAPAADASHDAPTSVAIDAAEIPDDVDTSRNRSDIFAEAAGIPQSPTGDQGGTSTGTADITPEAIAPASRVDVAADAAPAAAPEEPEPRAAGTQPKAEEPEPAAEEPTPKAEEPTPKAVEPTPKAVKPTPKAEQPTPKAEEPTPTADPPQKPVPPTTAEGIPQSPTGDQGGTPAGTAVTNPPPTGGDDLKAVEKELGTEADDKHGAGETDGATKEAEDHNKGMGNKLKKAFNKDTPEGHHDGMGDKLDGMNFD